MSGWYSFKNVHFMRIIYTILLFFITLILLQHINKGKMWKWRNETLEDYPFLFRFLQRQQEPARQHRLQLKKLCFCFVLKGRSILKHSDPWQTFCVDTTPPVYLLCTVYFVLLPFEINFIWNGTLHTLDADLGFRKTIILRYLKGRKIKKY